MGKATTKVATKRTKSRHFPTVREPKSAKELMFCRQWLIHQNHILAAKEAGYAAWESDALLLKRRFLAYLSEQKKTVELEVAREIVYNQKDLLNEMAGIGFANVLDYVIVELVEKEIETNGQKTTVTVKFFKQRPVDQLTRRQASAISDITFANGEVSYKIPDPAEKYRYLYSLAKNLGLFQDKLIMEHRHAHLHKQLDFKDASKDELAQLEDLLVNMLGDPARQVLGLPTILEHEA